MLHPAVLLPPLRRCNLSNSDIGISFSLWCVSLYLRLCASTGVNSVPFTRSQLHVVSATRCFAPSHPESVAFAHESPLCAQIGIPAAGLNSTHTSAVSSQSSHAMSHHHDLRLFHTDPKFTTSFWLHASLLLYASLFLIFSQQVLPVFGCLLDKFSLVLVFSLFFHQRCHSRCSPLLVAHPGLYSLLTRTLSCKPCLCKSYCPVTSASRRTSQESSLLFSSLHTETSLDERELPRERANSARKANGSVQKATCTAAQWRQHTLELVKSYAKNCAQFKNKTTTGRSINFQRCVVCPAVDQVATPT